MSLDYRSRLIAFYEHYAPDKVKGVDAQLTKYAGREEEVLQALVNKYGPEPGYMEGSNKSTSGADEENGEGPAEEWRAYYHQRLVQFYTTYAPEKLDSVDKQLTKYRGKEEAMFEALVNKYGPEPEYDATDNDAGKETSTPTDSPSSYRARLVALYEMYAPAKVSLVDTQLEKYHGQEEALIAALVNKYGPEPAAAGQDYRSRVVAIYEQYAPSKLGNVDAQLEKYSGREEEFIAALEQKYVHGNASGSTSAIASGRVSPSRKASDDAADAYQRMYESAVEKFVAEEVTAREKLLSECVAEFGDIYMLYESEERNLLVENEVIVFLVLVEECKRLVLFTEESTSCPVMVHPSFPFMNENAAVLDQFFSSLGTISLSGERLIDLETCHLLIAAVLGKEVFSGDWVSQQSDFQQDENKYFSFNNFRQLMIQNCHNEVDVLAKMQEFILTVKRKAKPLRLNVTKELHIGFWAYKCVKPCIEEKWERTWVILDGDSRLLLLRPNTVKPEITIALDHVLNCQLSSMLLMRAPRSCAKNGLYLQLSLGSNPVLLLLCPLNVQHGHALVRHIRQYCKKETKSSLINAPLGQSEKENQREGSLDESVKNSTEPLVSAVPVWCCRSGCTSFVRSFWLLLGDYIIHRNDGEQKTYSWRMTSVKDVYIATELGVKPPSTFLKYAFIIVHEKGSLFCCAESQEARDTLVANMKRVLFKLFLISHNGLSNSSKGISNIITTTPSLGANGDFGVNSISVEETVHRVPGFAQSISR
ncbi:uncharacterized protein TM35_000142840 [Trypanosoma theileri]|uniref:Uncharacterized protein n=1 Tax=Trypanosoma theileri TaxID=67003 RepID=A0A1X0NX86_9TRYP|nr:uncharacterized protein TM35_000142840 [Trypanosoma theileri]ORC89073.1 hypothetical protein TM35_000142840 [Trypanosoma theileri]